MITFTNEHCAPKAQPLYASLSPCVFYLIINTREASHYGRSDMALIVYFTCFLSCTKSSLVTGVLSHKSTKVAHTKSDHISSYLQARVLARLVETDNFCDATSVDLHDDRYDITQLRSSTFTDTVLTCDLHYPYKLVDGNNTPPSDFKGPSGYIRHFTRRYFGLETVVDLSLKLSCFGVENA
jgi:hypothetical protein